MIPENNMLCGIWEHHDPRHFVMHRVNKFSTGKRRAKLLQQRQQHCIWIIFPHIYLRGAIWMHISFKVLAHSYL